MRGAGAALTTQRLSVAAAVPQAREAGPLDTGGVCDPHNEAPVYSARMRLIPAACIATLAAACSPSTPEPAQPTTPAPAATAEPQPDSSRQTPWTITYSDGAANQYTFTQAAPGGEVAFEYVPVTPENSSTGSYSGGEPHKAQLRSDDPRIAELWQRIERAENDTASHAESRNKGTGAFTITTPTARRNFIVEMGPALDELHGFVAQFRQ